MGPSLKTSLIVIPCNTFHFLSSKIIYVKYDGKKIEEEKQIEKFLDGACHPRPLSVVAIIKGTKGVAHPVHKEVQDVQGANRILRAMLGDHIFEPKWLNVVQCRQYGSKRFKIIWMAQSGPKN